MPTLTQVQLTHCSCKSLPRFWPAPLQQQPATAVHREEPLVQEPGQQVTGHEMVVPSQIT